MQSEKCIPIKRTLVDYMCRWFPDFLFAGAASQVYAFRKENPDGIYDYIMMYREFYQGTISLVITETASCYNKSWKGIPWFTVGCSTDIRVLITGKNCYDPNIGWHRCKNNPEEFGVLLDGIREDIDTYVLDFFKRSHRKILADKCMVTTNSYMQTQFKELSEEDVQAVKEYMVRANKAYSEYRTDCRKKGQKATKPYFEIIPLHPVMECWLTDIQKHLNYTYLSESIRKQIIKDAGLLFRDHYDFYNLK